MCSYWRCGAEPVIATLMEEHDDLAALSSDIARATDAGAVYDSAVHRSADPTARADGADKSVRAGLRAVPG